MKFSKSQFPFLLFVFFNLIGANSLSAQDCRLDFEALPSVISRFNPFFYEHTWDNKNKKETAYLDKNRFIAIEQDGCERHHIRLTMIIAPKGFSKITYDFWIGEVNQMLQKIFYKNPYYYSFSDEFSMLFAQYLYQNGYGKLFKFNIREISFRCELSNGDWGAKVELEIIRYLYNKKIIKPGRPRNKDDGWLK